METFLHEQKETQPKILFATNIDGLGGGETSLLNNLVALKNRGYDVILSCPKGKLNEIALNLGIKTSNIKLPPIRLYFKIIPWISFFVIFKLFISLQKEKFDIVHVESPLTFYYFGTAAKLLNIPCVVTYHGYWKLNSRLNQFFLSKFCTKIYPVSINTAEDIYKSAFISRDKVKIIPLGLSDRFFSELPNKIKCRLINGLPIEKLIIMQIARFQEIKGQMILVEALAEIKKVGFEQLPTIVLVGDILNSLDNEAKNYKKQVEIRSNEEDIREHVLFLGWQENIPQLIKAADIVVIPSDFETFSMTTIEAMAVGTPVIATSSGGPKEIIQDQVTGYLIPPKNPHELAKTIMSVLANKSKSKMIAENSMRVAREKYSPSIRSTLLAKEYNELLMNKRF